jgi:NADH:ubiquinone oxidoreductase subunit C
MPAQRAADTLAAAGIAVTIEEEGLGAVVRLDAAHVVDALGALEPEGFGFLVDLFGTDTGENVEITYHVRAFARMEDLYLKATVDYDGEAPSAWLIFPAALYAEREAAELLGISFAGHPNPKRLLTTEEVGPLLRKSVAVRTAEEVRLPS